MTTASLLVFIILRVVFKSFLEEESLVAVYTLTAIFFYTLKQGLDVFFLSNYSRKVCFIVATSFNVFFFGLYLLLSSYEELYDQSLKHVMHDYSRHLELIFNKDFGFLSSTVLLGVVLFLNFFIIIAAIPSVIKFGNWYAKILKLVYQEQDEEDKSRMPKKIGGEERDEKEQEADLKRQSQKVLWRLNTYLTTMLLLIVMSHRYFLQFLPQAAVDGLRSLLMGICCYSVCSTMSSAIEFNGTLAYNYVMEYFKEESKDRRTELKQKIVSQIYYIWYHYFQFILRVLIPLLILMLVLVSHHLFTENSTYSQQSRVPSADFECPLHTNQLDILENLYTCQISESLSSRNEQVFMTNGMIERTPQDLGQERTQQNMIKHSLLTKPLLV